jgi:cytochrome c553
MKKLVIATALIVGTLSLMGADGKALTQKCVGCHGVDFSKKALGRSDVVKGWSAAKIESALKAYKTTTESDELIMKAQIGNYTEAQIKAVAKYIAGLK